MLAWSQFCHCLIVLKTGNYTAELTKHGFSNEYMYSVPVAIILSFCLESMCFTKGSSWMVHSCVVVLHCASTRPQSILSRLHSALPRKSPQVHFLNPHCQWSSSTCRAFSSPSSTAPLFSQRPGSCILIED